MLSCLCCGFRSAAHLHLHLCRSQAGAEAAEAGGSSTGRVSAQPVPASRPDLWRAPVGASGVPAVAAEWLGSPGQQCGATSAEPHAHWAEWSQHGAEWAAWGCWGASLPPARLPRPWAAAREWQPLQRRLAGASQGGRGRQRWAPVQYTEQFRGCTRFRKGAPLSTPPSSCIMNVSSSKSVSMVLTVLAIHSLGNMLCLAWSVVLTDKKCLVSRGWPSADVCKCCVYNHAMPSGRNGC